MVNHTVAQFADVQHGEEQNTLSYVWTVLVV